MAVFSIIVTFLLKVTHGFIVPSGNELCSLKLKANRFDLHKKKPLEESGLILLSPRRVRQWDCKRKDHGVMLFCPPTVAKIRNTKIKTYVFSKSASSIEKCKTVPAQSAKQKKYLRETHWVFYFSNKFLCLWDYAVEVDLKPKHTDKGSFERKQGGFHPPPLPSSPPLLLLDLPQQWRASLHDIPRMKFLGKN